MWRSRARAEPRLRGSRYRCIRGWGQRRRRSPHPIICRARAVQLKRGRRRQWRSARRGDFVLSCNPTALPTSQCGCRRQREPGPLAGLLPAPQPCPPPGCLCAGAHNHQLNANLRGRGLAMQSCDAAAADRHCLTASARSGLSCRATDYFQGEDDEDHQPAPGSHMGPGRRAVRRFVSLGWAGTRLGAKLRGARRFHGHEHGSDHAVGRPGSVARHVDHRLGQHHANRRCAPDRRRGPAGADRLGHGLTTYSRGSRSRPT